MGYIDEVENHNSALILKEASAVNVVLDFMELVMIIFLVLKVVIISMNVILGELTVTKMPNVLTLLVMVCIDAIVIQDRGYICVVK